MIHVIAQENNKIEIALNDALTKDEFIQIIHHLESLCKTYGPINVLLDATHLETYDFKLIIDEYNFYKEYKDKLRRVALVSDMKFESFIVNIFKSFIDVQFKTFKPEEVEEARKWIFPSPLP
ncbi:MAG: STAS/SEC14 domain-containing protein [Calditrichaceae bacterium]